MSKQPPPASTASAVGPCPTTSQIRRTPRHWMLVGCFWFNGPLRQYFSLYRAVSQREGERGERIDESKNVQTTPPAPTASAIGPCPTVIKIVGRPGTGSLPSTIAPPDHPPRHWKFTQHHRTTRPTPYASRHRLEESSEAVHIVDKSVTAMAEKTKSKRLAVEWRDEEGVGPSTGSNKIIEEGGSDRNQEKEGEVT